MSVRPVGSGWGIEILCPGLQWQPPQVRQPRIQTSPEDPGQPRGEAARKPPAASSPWGPLHRHFGGPRSLTEAQDEAKRQSAPAVLDDAQRARILALATDLPRLWREPTTPYRERKRMVRLLVEDITVTKGPEVIANVRFKGGAMTTLKVKPALAAWQLRQTNPLVLKEINMLLDECLSLVQDRVAGRPIEVVRAYDGACPQAMLDARELRKVFLNLILNGLDAMTERGTLTLRTAYRPETRAIEVTVEDTGVGMMEETRSRIFDLFFTTKPKGTGLGMAIARSVVDLHGGGIDVESAAGRGTKVRVNLPTEPPA